MFGDFRAAAATVYRITTQSNAYYLAIHERRGRKYVVVRGVPGGDREHVTLRDGDPRVGEHSLFELAPERWVGESLEIATMTTSTITAVEETATVEALAAVGGERRAQPHGNGGTALPIPGDLPSNPAMIAGLSRGTTPGAAPGAHAVAHPLVVGASAAPAPAPEVPYPERHVRHAEHAVAYLRSIHRRDQLFVDLRYNDGLRERLFSALDEIDELSAALRKRRGPR
jgi:hypothetical protein